MKKIFLLLLFGGLCAAFSASAQMLNFGQKAEAVKKEAVKEVVNEPTAVAPATNDGVDDNYGIQIEVSQEEKEAIADSLRDDLRDTLKNNEIKERVEYVEDNNYIDRVMYRREMLKQSQDYKVAEHAAASLKKAQVNPKSDKQLNDYILERAGVPEK